MNNILKVKNVSQNIQGKVILDKITFDVEAGEIIGLLGPNGVGKSTLLRRIANVEQTIGDVYINNKLNDFTKFRTDVMLVTTEINIPRNMSLQAYCKLLTISFEIDFEFVHEYASKLEIDLTKPVSSLSKGLQEICQLIASLATSCNLLLLDEPFSAIDIYKRDIILQMIIDSKLNGKTIIITTHLIDDIETIIDRVLYIHSAALELDLDSEEIQVEATSISAYLKNHYA